MDAPVVHQTDALLNSIRQIRKGAPESRQRDFGLLHRLDRTTSGLARGLSIEGYGLRQQFVDRMIDKTYIALVHNTPQPAGGVKDTPIREMRIRGRKRAVLDSAGV